MKPSLASVNEKKRIQCSSNLVGSLVYFSLIMVLFVDLLAVVNSCYTYLANTLGQFRDKDKYGASKLLAYLPVISPKGRKDVSSWFPAAKRAIIHYCIALILRPYHKDR